MDFNHIPDDCIRIILKRLSVRYRLPLRIICHRWMWIVESLCLTARSLTLVGFKGRNRSLTDDDFLIVCNPGNGPQRFHPVSYYWNPFRCLFVPKLFSQLTELDIHMYESFEHLVPLMLELWSKTLTSLTVRNFPQGDQISVIYPSFWFRVNQLSKLQRLRLYSLKSMTIPIDQMTVLSKLSHLTLESYSSNLADVFRQLGPNLRELSLTEAFNFDERSWNVVDWDKLNKTLKLNSAMASSVTKLEIDFMRYLNNLERERKLLQLITQHFTSVTILDADFITVIPIGELFTSLTKLSHLRRLRISFVESGTDFPLLAKFPIRSLRTLSLWFTEFAQPSDATIVSFFKVIPSVFPALTQLSIHTSNDVLQTKILSLSEMDFLSDFMFYFNQTPAYLDDDDDE